MAHTGDVALAKPKYARIEESMWLSISENSENWYKYTQSTTPTETDSKSDTAAIAQWNNSVEAGTHLWTKQ